MLRQLQLFNSIIPVAVLVVTSSNSVFAIDIFSILLVKEYWSVIVSLPSCIYCSSLVNELIQYQTLLQYNGMYVFIDCYCLLVSYQLCLSDRYVPVHTLNYHTEICRNELVSGLSRKGCKVVSKTTLNESNNILPHTSTLSCKLYQSVLLSFFKILCTYVLSTAFSLVW